MGQNKEGGKGVALLDSGDPRASLLYLHRMDTKLSPTRNTDHVELELYPCVERDVWLLQL